MLNKLLSHGVKLPQNIQFRSLRSRIATVFLGLILIIQTAGSLAIRFNIDKNAKQSIEKELIVGERVFLNLLSHNSENLIQSAKILATDYGFRQAIASRDYETIISAISNHQSRINADIAFFYDPNTEYIAISGGIEEKIAFPPIKKLISQAVSIQKNQTFVIFKGQPYLLVAVAVKAPITIGWIVMGFEMNSRLANQLHELSGLEISFIVSEDTNAKPSASTLNQNDASLVAKQIQHPYLNQGFFLSHLSQGEYQSKVVPIFNDDHSQLVAVIQKSINEVTAPYKTLQINLLILTVLGAFAFLVGIYYVSNRITKPIAALAISAASLERGEYEKRVKIEREDEIGLLSRVFDSMSDAIALREKNIKRLAFEDTLTGLPNRAAFVYTLQQTIDHHLEKHPFSILVMDLNRFKQINNILGHSVGNEIIIKLAEQLSSNKQDGLEMVARLGGDEFAILLPNADMESALKIATQLSYQIETPLAINNQMVDLSTGFGIVTFPYHGSTPDQLLSRAEMSMYYAKTRNLRAVIFDNSYDIGSDTNLSLLGELREAIHQNHLHLYLQPKVDLHSNKIISAEALVRWHDPVRGQIYPDQFIPFAEQTGAISEITLWMIRAAANQCAEWRKLNMNITIAVNLSARDLIDHDMPNKMMAILEEFALDRDSLTLEITESSIMDDTKRALLTLNNFSQLGIRLAIDDFGTGHSSLAYLKSLPIQDLKIDKSFVMNMIENQNDRIIVQSTIALGHNLGLKVIAEGVENASLYETLQQMGCDYAQGYFISKPMKATDFTDWLKKSTYI